MTDRKLLDLRRKLLAVGGGTGIALTGLAAGSSAYASVVRFDNSSGDYTWFLEEWLDVTRSPLDQDGWSAPSAFLQYLYYGYSREVDFYGYGTVANDYGIATSFMSGDEVGYDDFYSSYGWAAGARYEDYGQLVEAGLNDDPAWNVFVGGGSPGFIGLRFMDEEEAAHYGWMKVLWNDPEERFDALAWAYETDEDKPIVIDDSTDIPEPGTLALFAAGAGALLIASRRRRRQELDGG